MQFDGKRLPMLARESCRYSHFLHAGFIWLAHNLVLSGLLTAQVLDYQNTSATLLPLVAVSYALIFMVWPSKLMWSSYANILT